MFNLEVEIRKWRKSIAAAVPGPERVRELENHLRDHIETKVRSGISAEVAFAEAVKRIGEPNALAREFHQLGTWRPKSRPVIAVLIVHGLLIATFAIGIVRFFT